MTVACLNLFPTVRPTDGVLVAAGFGQVCPYGWLWDPSTSLRPKFRYIASMGLFEMPTRALSSFTGDLSLPTSRSNFAAFFTKTKTRLL